jgi:hypothetical protein
MLLKYSRIKQKEQSEYLQRLKDYYADKVGTVPTLSVDGRTPPASAWKLNVPSLFPHPRTLEALPTPRFQSSSSASGWSTTLTWLYPCTIAVAAVSRKVGRRVVGRSFSSTPPSPL